MANARPQTPGQLHRTGVGAPGPGLGGEGELYTDLVSGLDYQKVGGSWGQIIQPTLPTTKLTGQVTDAQIAAVAGSKVTGSISTATIPAASVTGAEQWTYGTAFPGSPSNGDKHTLVDSTTNPTWSFTFRYNAGSSSAYKWESLGMGRPIAQYQLSGNSSSSTGTNIGTTFTIPRAGDWRFHWGATLDDQNQWQNIGLWLRDVTGSSDIAAIARTEYASGASGASGGANVIVQNGVAVSRQYCLRLYDSNNVAVVAAVNAFLEITPLRCS